MAKSSSAATRARVIPPPKRLAAKVGRGKGLDRAALKRAEAVLTEAQANATEWADEYLEHLQEVASALTHGHEENKAGLTTQAYRWAHEMRGSGASFGFPLVTRIGDSLCRYIDALPPRGIADATVVCSHADALRAVISADARGDGGDLGQALAAELGQLVDRAIG